MELLLIYCYYTDCLILYFVYLFSYFCVLRTRANFVIGLWAVSSHVHKQELNLIIVIIILSKYLYFTFLSSQ
jgi:hypothetical protein